LSIVQGLARANGGDVWYEPNVPHGSVFGVRLPASAAPTSSAPAGQASGQVSGP
jgi:signal transduction histidine kinase